MAVFLLVMADLVLLVKPDALAMVGNDRTTCDQRRETIQKMWVPWP